MAVSELLVWVDCEMTGLDLTADALVEVAVLVTDPQLQVLGHGVDVVIKPSAQAVDQMGDFVRTMHSTSGLLTALAGGLSMRDAEQRVLDYVREFVPEPRKAPLAGNTVHTDRAFLARDMAEFESYVHYRNVDVSDIKESIEELRYYRETVFVELPGPDSATAKEIAARHQGAVTQRVQD